MANKKIVVGILAHVDTGKTTFSESMLYESGFLRSQGRVDHQNTFLDTDELERARGITIFSKQAVFSVNNVEITLLDTPGHVDFSTEMERTLQVLDYAILLICGFEGVRGHTLTLWKLLKSYNIPTFIFVNKMDRVEKGENREESLETKREEIVSHIAKKLKGNFLDFTDYGDASKLGSSDMESLALCDDRLMNDFLETGKIGEDGIRNAICNRNIFPCYFGSALYNQGVVDFLDGFTKYTKSIDYGNEFGARVFKINRDEQGERLSFLKVTGGSLKVKDVIESEKGNSEKVNQIRVYSGEKYQSLGEASPGTICAVTGLTSTYPGQGLGDEPHSIAPMLEPFLNYTVYLPDEIDEYVMLKKLQLLEEEDPMLKVVWDEELNEIQVQLMGEIQLEILKNIIQKRFNIAVEFDTGKIMYRETISESVVGVGHFEPLRHYAEVHLLLEPLESGSGIIIENKCSTDILDINWQNAILTHIEEREHLGVLTGSPITDMRITLLAGKGHIKHTGGGDFRQATYRGIRQGLKKASSVLLEPFYDFILEVPTTYVGRSISDISGMSGTINPPTTNGEMSIITGSAPVARMNGYQTQVTAYTGGVGKLFYRLKGYEPCHNARDVIAEIGYDSERDVNNPTGSIFCANGVGFPVPWDMVEEYMHLSSDAYYRDGAHRVENINGDNAKGNTVDSKMVKVDRIDGNYNTTSKYSEIQLTEREIDALYVPTRLPQKKNLTSITVRADSNEISEKDGDNWKSSRSSRKSTKKKQGDYLLVDGYNIIYAWQELGELAKLNLDSARYKLMDILCNYQGITEATTIIVFDAYKVEGGVGSNEKYKNIHVVYTKEAETADTYIEKTVQKISKDYHVKVATSDILEQMIIVGQGAHRLSAKDLKEEIETTNNELRNDYMKTKNQKRNYLFDYLDEKATENLEKIRLGENEDTAE